MSYAIPRQSASRRSWSMVDPRRPRNQSPKQLLVQVAWPRLSLNRPPPPFLTFVLSSHAPLHSRSLISGGGGEGGGIVVGVGVLGKKVRDTNVQGIEFIVQGDIRWVHRALRDNKPSSAKHSISIRTDHPQGPRPGRAHMADLRTETEKGGKWNIVKYSMRRKEKGE